jgi:molecular chaperone GrpE
VSKQTKTHSAEKDESKPKPEPAATIEATDPSPALQAAADEVLEADEDVVFETEDAQGTEVPTEQQLEQLRRQYDEAKDRALRCQAELDNYQKRVARQMSEERRYAQLPLIRDLLPVWDNMGRAVEAAEKNHDVTGLLEGFRMVTRQLEGVLKRHHCSEVQALGQPFDPHFHEAISQQPSDEHPANTVLHVTQTGFQLHDRVVRPSQVVVSVAPAKNDLDNTDKSDAQTTEPS